MKTSTASIHRLSRTVVCALLVSPISSVGCGVDGPGIGETDSADDDDNDNDNDDDAASGAETGSASVGSTTTTSDSTPTEPDSADATSGDDAGDTDGTGNDSNGDSDSDSDSAPPRGPHAMGFITLGERHPAIGGNAEPFASAFFIPDADNFQRCTDDVAGCQVQMRANCGSSCDASVERCALDEQCESVCVPHCNDECEGGEVCESPSPGEYACRPAESFDAGILSFAGTNTPITLFPPYSYGGDVGGAPFAPEAEVSVSATGASDAGFQAFEASFSAPDFVLTNLEGLSVEELILDLETITWTPGTDEIEVRILNVPYQNNVPSQTAACPADDEMGAFVFPRAVIDAVMDVGPPGRVDVSVNRRRATLDGVFETQGTLSHATVQPQGWVEFRGESTEDVRHDVHRDCRDCTLAVEDLCFDAWAGCNFDTACNAMLACTNACYGTPDCINACENQHPSAAALFGAWMDCACDSCAIECYGACE